MNEEEAKTELKKILDGEIYLQREVYCPEINGYCRTDCIQYIKTTGDVFSDNTGFHVNLHKGYCLRYMR